MAENKEEQKIEENKEDEVIELKKTIETQKIQLEEQEDRLKRVAAEFENYKKRSRSGTLPFLPLVLFVPSKYCLFFLRLTHYSPHSLPLHILM